MEASYAVVSVIFVTGNVESIIYLGAGARTVVPGVLGHNIALAT